MPPTRLRQSAKHENDFQIDLTRAQIEQFPPFNERDVESEEKWNDYERRYRSKWETGPVMHRAETDRNITPATAQMTQGTGATGPTGGGASFSGASAGTRVERIIPPTANEVTINSSAAGIGARWDTFQSHLRQRRKQAVLSCKTCMAGPARSFESTEQERKAVSARFVVKAAVFSRGFLSQLKG